MQPFIAYSASAAVKLSVRFEYLEVTDKVGAFRLEQSGTPDNPVPECFSANLSSRVTEGFTTLEAAQAFATGKAAAIQVADRLVLLAPGVREAVRVKGFNDAFDTKEETIIRAPYSALLAGADKSDVVRLDYGSNLLFDTEDQVLPAAIYFNYIEAQMHNRSYDLNKALEILKANPAVSIVTKDRRGLEHSGIQSIPYYNAEEGRSQFIEFKFAPTLEQARALWAEQSKLNKKYPSVPRHQAVFNLDMLGLRAGGAARFKTFYGE